MRSTPGGLISSVLPGSFGHQLGLEPGDRLIAINDHRLRDVIDVQFYAADDELVLQVERGGDRWTAAAVRDPGVELGLDFAHPTFDVDIRRCANNCDFCFVKQNPPGMRRSLYVKDDDYRYSFLYGSFVTLTNLRQVDWQRLEEQRLSPLYVSVHATDPGLRRRFLRRPAAPDIIEQMRRLGSLGIEVHTQVVLVPGLNDGEHLRRTVRDLGNLYREPVASVSIVPIGLTKYHSGGCRPYKPEEAKTILDQVEPWRLESQSARGCTLVYPSDEWYLLAGREVPPASEYDGFHQVENGVGMVRGLLDEWEGLKEAALSQNLKRGILVCGTLIAPVLARILHELDRSRGDGCPWRLIPVVNRFFGSLTTVSGLLTGQDVLDALRDKVAGDVVLLPRVMFAGLYGTGKSHPDTSLDGMTVTEVSDQLSADVELVEGLGEALAVLGDDTAR